MAPLTKLSGWLDIHTHFFPPSTEAERVEKWHTMRAAKFLAPKP
jgi:predicted TIM-barrel fold metal-dependent hydrolase